MENKIYEKLQALLEDYTKKLPGKLEVLQQQWKSLQKTFSKRHFKDFHREAHSLTGSAGTYGFSQLSIAARELEIILKSLLIKDKLTSEDELAISQSLDKLIHTPLIHDEKTFDAFQPYPTNKIIYVLDKDEKWITTLESDFRSSRYQLLHLKQFSDLLKLMAHQSPYILIINTDCINDDEIKQLAALGWGGEKSQTKPVLPEQLIKAVKSRVKNAEIFTDHIAYDSLTGVLNHSRILHQLEAELRLVETAQQLLAFVMIDIDGLENINKQHGRAMGDQVLRQFAHLLTSRLRKTDYLGRYEGEQFALVLPNITAAQSKKLLEELCEKFSQIPFLSEPSAFSVTFSAGIATFPEYQSSIDLIQASERALSQAKKQGKNQVVAI